VKGVNIFFLILVVCILVLALLASMQGINLAETNTQSESDLLLNKQTLENPDTNANQINDPDISNKDFIEESPSIIEEQNVNLERNDDNMNFCGISSYTPCEVNEDCIILGCLNHVCQSKTEEEIENDCIEQECYDYKKYGYVCACFDSHCKWG